MVQAKELKIVGKKTRYCYCPVRTHALIPELNHSHKYIHLLILHTQTQAAVSTRSLSRAQPIIGSSISLCLRLAAFYYIALSRNYPTAPLV